jgi:CheY-like chemotaxis protein
VILHHSPSLRTLRALVAMIDPNNPITILLVDDDAPHCSLVSMLLEDQGYRVLVAHCGATGLELADQADVAVIDMIMPGLTGMETIPLLQSSNPNLKVIACSGSEKQRFADDLQALGVTVFLPKPFSIEELIYQVERLARRDHEKFDVC